MDSFSYMVMGYLVIFAGLGLYLVSLLARRRKLAKRVEGLGGSPEDAS